MIANDALEKPLGAVEVDRVPSLETRAEERQPLKMIVVEMGHHDVNLFF